MERDDRQQVFSLGELALIEAAAKGQAQVLKFLSDLDFPISGYACLRAIGLLSRSADWPESELSRLLSVARVTGFSGTDLRNRSKMLTRRIEQQFSRCCDWPNTQITLLIIQLEILVDEYMPDADLGEYGPLQTACKYRDVSDVIVQQLLMRGFDVNLPSAHHAGRTAIQIAVKAGNIATIELLLKYRANVNAPPYISMGRTALQAAAENGCIATVKLLLNQGANVNASPSRKYGVTALQAAAIQGNMRIAQMLIKAGADVGAPGAAVEGRTAINGAAEQGRLDMVKLLLDFYKFKDGESISGICDEATQYAKAEYHWAMVDLLENYQREPGWNP